MKKIEFISPKLEYISGVYKIVFDDKYFYIGSTTNFHQRIPSWKSKINGFGTCHKNIYTAINNSKLAVMTIIEKCDKSKCKDREDFYIKKNWGNEYLLNSSPSAYGNARPMTDAEKLKKSIDTTINAPTLKTISIRKTECEWNTIKEKMILFGNKDLSVYIRTEIYMLKKDINSIPKKAPIDCGEKIEKRPYLPLETLKIVEEISKKTKTPTSTIITRLIIDPLLS